MFIYSKTMSLELVESRDISNCHISLDEPFLSRHCSFSQACLRHSFGKENQKIQKSQRTDRKSDRTDYTHHGEKICGEFLKFIHFIGQDKLNSFIQHYKANGAKQELMQMPEGPSGVVWPGASGFNPILCIIVVTFQFHALKFQKANIKER